MGGGDAAPQPRLLLTLLELGGRESQELFASIDPFALGAPVSWAGSEPAPDWLDLARELTERWHHQQQIREAVGAPPLDEPRFLRPVLATFAFSLPQAVRDVVSPIGTSIGLRIDGESGGDWTVVRDEPPGGASGPVAATNPSAAVTIDQDTAWRMYVAGARPAGGRATIPGRWGRCAWFDVAWGVRLVS